MAEQWELTQLSKEQREPGVVVPVCNPITGEAEAEG